jgi:hypothetical protein
MSLPKAAVADAVSATTSRFSVHASAEPGVMPRVLELFAKRGLVPDCWHSIVARPGMTLAIDIEIAGLERDTADYVANCMRQIAGVELVLTV